MLAKLISFISIAAALTVCWKIWDGPLTKMETVMVFVGLLIMVAAPWL